MLNAKQCPWADWKVGIEGLSSSITGDGATSSNGAVTGVSLTQRLLVVASEHALLKRSAPVIRSTSFLLLCLPAHHALVYAPWCLQEFLRAHNTAAAEARASAAAAAARAEAEAAAAAAGGVGPLSLWHEMQQRQQAEAAALESEASVGPGLQGPGGMLGDDLWMFDGGLFAEEGALGFWLLFQASRHICADLLFCTSTQQDTTPAVVI
jgi:hypothetical protein